METFPQYFRKEGTMVRRDSPTTGVMIKLPPPKKTLPNSMDPTHDIYPTRERFDAFLIDFEISDEQTFNDFLDTYFQNANYMGSLWKQKKESLNPQSI